MCVTIHPGPRKGFAVSLVAWLAGCTGTAPTVPTDPAAPQPVQPVTYVVSGMVSELVDGVSRPLGGREVFLWIDQSTGGGWSQTVFSDQNGRYTAMVPKARVFAYAWHPPDQLQPCLASAAVDRDTTRVNTPVQMVVSAGNGYQDWWQLLPGAGDVDLEIELKR